MSKSLGCVVAAVGVIACTGACTSSMGGAAARSKDQSILSVFAPTSPGDAARMALDEWNPEERRRGILLLANAPWGGEDPYMRLYRAAMTDGDAAVRTVAIRALAMHGGGDDVALVLPELDSDDRLLRWEAARALQRLHDPQAVDALLKHLLVDDEREVLVRTAVADALGQYAEPRVVAELVGALDDPDLAVVRSAERSLRFLTGEKLGTDPRDWEQWIATAGDPCTNQTMYEYRAFHRDVRWYEYINPFADVPNELPASPAGMQPIADRDS